MQGTEILKVLPESMADAIKKAGPDWERAEEIRIRAKRPLLFYMNNEEYVLKREGVLVQPERGRSNNCYITAPEEIEKIIDKISGHSLYAYQDELRQGFFTLEGGHRVGILGKAVTEEGKIKTLKYLSFLNIRIAHEKKGCGMEIASRLVKEKRPCHTLILSPPGCGKTTLLRDLIRLFSDGFDYEEHQKRCWFPGRSIGVVDERSEIGASIRGIPTNDLGMRTDLLDGCPKAEGIFLLLRSMAPEMIAVDEIGSEKDFFAIKKAVNSGFTIFATAHGSSFSELEKKPVFASFLKENIFERYVLLSGRRGKGTVEKIETREADSI